MKTLSKTILIILIILGASSIKAQAPYKEAPSSTELVVGSISGEASWGEFYEKYEWEESFFSGGDWEFIDLYDNRKSYSENDLYAICLSEAKEKYGHAYPNLVLRNFKYEIVNRRLPDEVRYSQVIGSGAKYKYMERQKKVYKYSATIVIENY